MRAICHLTSALMLLLIPLGVQGAGANAPGSIRFLQGGHGDGGYLAALEIRLTPGYVTYWRTPGDAGLPPVFDWSGSDNVADVSVSWPAPTRINEAGSIVYGFYDGVTLPLRVRPKQANAPVNLKLRLQYGVCKEQCIPVESVARIVLDGTEPDGTAVRQAMESLPKIVNKGATTPFAFIDHRLTDDASRRIVTLRIPPGIKAELFAEGPEGWVFSTSEGTLGKAAHTMDFTITREAPTTAVTPPFLLLTARAGTQAIELRLPEAEITPGKPK